MSEVGHAHIARSVVAGAGRGSLSTIATDPAGYPFGSLVVYADDAGRPVLALSSLAEHTRNIRADARASLMVSESAAEGQDPLDAARVTLLGALEESETDEARDLYLANHPGATYVDFPDFAFFRLDVQAVRYVGGFGAMSWVGAEEYLAADPLVPHAGEILEHMNADHPDAVLAYARAFGGADPGPAQLTGVDRLGFDVRAGDRQIRVPFARPLGTVDEVRAEMIRLVREARSQLGSGQG